MKLVVTLLWSPPLLSRPARGAWVEMSIIATLLSQVGVAPRKGRVG